MLLISPTRHRGDPYLIQGIFLISGHISISNQLYLYLHLYPYFLGSGVLGFLFRADVQQAQALKSQQVTKEQLLGGSWDLVITYNWAHKPPYNWGNLYKATQGDY